MVDSCYVGALPPGFNQRAPAKTETLVLNAQTTSLSSGALTTAYAVVVIKSACAARVSSKLQNSAAVVGTNLALVVHVKLMHSCSRGCPTVVPILRRFFIFATCKHHLVLASVGIEFCFVAAFFEYVPCLSPFSTPEPGRRPPRHIRTSGG